MNTKPRSGRHLALLHYIMEFKQKHNGLSPTVREMAEQFHTSNSNIKYHLMKLEALGAIEFYGNTKARSIMIPNSEWRMIPEIEETRG